MLLLLNGFILPDENKKSLKKDFLNLLIWMTNLYAVLIMQLKCRYYWIFKIYRKFFTLK